MHLCARLEDVLKGIRERDWPQRKVLYLIWKDPWMTIAPQTYIGQTLQCVGWKQIDVPEPARYPQIRLDELAGRVELLLLSSEPYRFGEADVNELARRWPHCQVQLIDGQWTSWYGSRAIEGIDALAQLAASYNT
jgi:ABC-type Fe3+-hydroxamate transport system substrate-binding protein